MALILFSTLLASTFIILKQVGLYSFSHSLLPLGVSWHLKHCLAPSFHAYMVLLSFSLSKMSLAFAPFLRSSAHEFQRFFHISTILLEKSSYTLNAVPFSLKQLFNIFILSLKSKFKNNQVSTLLPLAKLVDAFY